MNIQVTLLLLEILIQICDCHIQEAILSRKKRYLNFPQGTTAVAQISLSIGIMWELTNSPFPRWNEILSWDLGFKLPNNTGVFLSKRPGPIRKPYAKKRELSEYYFNQLHRRERRDLYRSIEGIIDSHGADGRYCLYRTLCEARQLLKPGRSLLEDILHIVFYIPPGGEDEFEIDGYDWTKSNKHRKHTTFGIQFVLHHISKGLLNGKMRTGVLFPLLLLITAELVGTKTFGSERKLSRKRRYLTFPPGSFSVVNLSYSSAYVWELYPAPTWNHITELDLGFYLPNGTETLFYGRRRKNELHRMQRRELYFNIESMLDMYGIEGRSCVSRAICEAKIHLATGNSLLEDVLLTIFTVPDGTGDELDLYKGATSGSSCKTFRRRCPFSLINHLLEERVIDY
ncbi:hypothetical protein L9F63_015380 [Diploptera punctata]|uniref:Uncharacterized protein n=1 Tax=Diploptera punctata TaxID=6984 RepID=A0AAD8A5R7_DIPPU|nr:hypothetical protein L9F63_015380 [Diploptera punctata]